MINACGVMFQVMAKDSIVACKTGDGYIFMILSLLRRELQGTCGQSQNIPIYKRHKQLPKPKCYETPKDVNG